MEMFFTNLNYKLNRSISFSFNCACVVKPLAGQTVQTWHSLACAVKTEGKTVLRGGPYLIGEMYLCGAVNTLPASMYDYICVYSLRHNTGVRLQAIWCYFLPSSGKSLNFMDNEQLPPLP